MASKAEGRVVYDLLIKGGHVLDPATDTDAILDIGIVGGSIVALASDLDSAEASSVMEIRGNQRYVVPGLIDMHTHVAHGATTLGVGLACCDPDTIGVKSGVTTVVDCGSVGVANIGVFPAHILKTAQTRVICYLNVGSFAHTMPGHADINALSDVNQDAIAKCIESNPGLVKGFKLRVVGPIMAERGEELVRASKAVAVEHHLPLMVHIGDSEAAGYKDPGQISALTRFVLGTLTEGDVLTHLCTPHVGGVMDAEHRLVPELKEARSNGVVLDPALGRGNFGYEVAMVQAQLGLHPDTISSDLTVFGQSFHCLLECMSKFMAIGYSLRDVVTMTTSAAARAIGLQDKLGEISVGREADLSIIDVVDGAFQFVDTAGTVFRGSKALVPVHTVRKGEPVVPGWGTHPWGWLPANDTSAA